MGGSQRPVCVSAFALKPSPFATDNVQVKVTTLGNVFTPGDAATFGVLSARDATVRWSARDYAGREVGGGEVPVDPVSREGRIDAGVLPHGYYTLSVRGSDHTAGTVVRTAGFAVMNPAPDPAQTADSMFGISHHRAPVSGFTWDDTTALAAKAGVENVRVDSVWWNNIEKPKGEYHFPELSEHVVGNLAERGQQALLILGLGNADYGNIPSTPEAYEAFGRYAEAVADHYKGKVGALEVWNEYYGGFTSGVCSQSAKCYAKMIAAAYPKIKAKAPGVRVVGASSFKAPLDWFEELFQLGGLDNMDAISIHPYRAPGTPEGVELDVEGLKKLIRKYNGGADKPIWITEQGWSSAGAKGVGVSEKVQARSVARALLTAKAAGIEKYFWYDLVNDGVNPDNSEHNFGMLRKTGPDATSLNPKPSFLAYATAARELTGAKFVGKVDTGDKDLHAYRFEGVTALWSGDRVGRPVKLRARQPVTVADMLGTEHTLTPVGGWVYLTLTGEPVYVRASVDGVKKARLVTLSAPDRVAAGGTVPVTVRVDGSGGPRRTVSVEIEGRRHEVPAASGRVVVDVPAGSVAGTRTVAAKVVIGGVQAGLAAIEAEVTAAPVEVDVTPEIGRDRANRLKITVSNRSTDRAAQVRSIDWSYGDRSGSLPVDAAVAPLASSTFFAEVGEQPYYSVKPVQVTADVDGRSVQDGDAFAFSPIVRATPRLRNGKLTGLDKAPVIDLASVGAYKTIGAADADADMWATWDHRHLYVSAVVKEETYRPAKKAFWLPAGDSLGIGVQPGKPGAGLGAWGAEWYMLFAGQSAEGNKVFVESLPRTYPVGLMDGAKVEVARDEQARTTTYLVAIPWERIPPLSPEDPAFSLTLTVNKNDGVDRDNYRSLGLRGWQSWGDGLNNWKLAGYQQAQVVR
ncbi:glycosyl hydrolase [Nonomuraea sp. NPDC046570]|uniref:glycosyl hydrolase n=1 Tax=Nonomuraea sp. NPDC046570 TaxID=3155255 RepID=UPI0033EFFB0F